MLRSAICFLLIVLISCEGKEKNTPIQNETAEEQDTSNFFPVTSYLKGQIYELQRDGINPVKYTTTGNKTDSIWLALEKMPEAFAPFLETVIDSANLKNTFKQVGFLDQTINAFTFSYDPKVVLPEDSQLQHWDIYIDPETQKVKRIYIVKKTGKQNLLQLTWQADAFCKMVWIKNTDTPSVEKEILIKWDF